MNNDQFYFWILLLIFSTMYKIQPGRHWVTAQSPTKPPIDQPEKELKVNIGDSASLQCCVAKNVVGMIALFKQPNRQRPQLIVKLFKSARGTFSTEFQIPGVQIEKSSNCFNIIILNITQSDEAMYYCAVTVPYVVFADGTYLKIQGEHVTITSETAKPTLSDNSVVCEPTLHGNNTNMNTQENTVIGLGTALGLCALLIFCLTYYILRRRKRDKSKCFCYKKIITVIFIFIKNTNRCVSVFIVNASPGTRQEYEEETLNYAALQFSKKKAKAEKRKTGSSDECVYSDVNTTVRYNIVDS
ncbi:uncharacterized protein LOC131357868 isoform X2 [Hemibagrus wyckioides]|uniref:uncharacterized protein LOC131357868 isoform X2 n=1 Tax=Hemibagrus wyckioides TaxID=337641 RepID=UPI00266D582A|nr:uncharacterized protein LOC131357868 isoform X2 [Hemibagrus wyckioides]